MRRAGENCNVPRAKSEGRRRGHGPRRSPRLPVAVGARVAAGVAAESTAVAGDPPPAAPPPRTYLTNPPGFVDVSRGNPRPHTLKGDALVAARLTPETWRLEIVSDGTTEIATPLTIDKGNAIDLATLEKLGQQHGRKFLKAMQCLNIAQPLGQGLWEGVPLREVLKLVGRINNIRRIYYWGFHNNDPKQIFQSSLSYTQAMDRPRRSWAVGRVSAQRAADLARTRRAGAHGHPVGMGSSRSNGCSGSC